VLRAEGLGKIVGSGQWAVGRKMGLMVADKIFYGIDL